MALGQLNLVWLVSKKIGWLVLSWTGCVITKVPRYHW